MKKTPPQINYLLAPPDPVNIGLWFKMCFAGVGPVMGYCFGGWSRLLGVLLFVATLDIITGCIRAYHEKQLSSSIGFWGVTRKAGMFAIISLAFVVGSLFGDAAVLRDVVCGWYVGVESLSVLENAAKIGLPVPKKLTHALESFADEKQGVLGPYPPN